MNTIRNRFRVDYEYVILSGSEAFKNVGIGEGEIVLTGKVKSAVRSKTTNDFLPVLSRIPCQIAPRYFPLFSR